MFLGPNDYSVTFANKYNIRRIACYEEGCEGTVQAKTEQWDLDQAIQSQAIYVLLDAKAVHVFATRHR